MDMRQSVTRVAFSPWRTFSLLNVDQIRWTQQRECECCGNSPSPYRFDLSVDQRVIVSGALGEALGPEAGAFLRVFEAVVDPEPGLGILADEALEDGVVG